MKRTSRLFYAAAVWLGLMTSLGFANREDRKTELTVHERIEVPGATLEPGDYTIELVDATSNNHIVMFKNADEGKVVSTSIAVPTRRTDVTGETKFTFYETPVGRPPALRTWFYPGDQIGREFVYPESRGREIARTSRRYVPTMADDHFNKLHSHNSSKNHDPAIVAVREVTVYAVAPDEKKTDYDRGQNANLEADRKTWAPNRYVQGSEMDESRLARQIRKEIVTLPYYSVWDHINFRVAPNGNVQLGGSVYRPSMKKSVERVVKNVEGVRNVENKIEVLPTSTHDDDIRRAVYRSIYSHPALQNYQLRAVPPIHIIVNNGNVTLEGVVANQMDKNVAGIQANTVSGVFKVENNLRVQS